LKNETGILKKGGKGKEKSFCCLAPPERKKKRKEGGDRPLVFPAAKNCREGSRGKKKKKKRSSYLLCWRKGGRKENIVGRPTPLPFPGGGNGDADPLAWKKEKGRTEVSAAPCESDRLTEKRKGRPCGRISPAGE